MANYIFQIIKKIKDSEEQKEERLPIYISNNTRAADYNKNESNENKNIKELGYQEVDFNIDDFINIDNFIIN
jgi:hypothetical protein